MIPTAHSTNRKLEWENALILTLVGLSTPISPLLGLTPPPSIDVFENRYLSGASVSLILAMLGLMRMMALYANGRWKQHGCHLRLLGASAGALIWSQLLAGAIIVTISSKIFYLSMIFFLVFAIFEVLSLRTSMQDRRYYARLRANPAFAL